MPPLLGRSIGGLTRSRTPSFDPVINFVCRRPKLVLGIWAALAIGVNIVVPQLEKVIAHDATPFIPSNAPSIHAYYEMNRAFGSPNTKSPAYVVIEHRSGLTVADQRYYSQLVARLKSDDKHVAEVSDYLTHPELRSLLVSKDNQAEYIPVGLRHPVGSPRANDDVRWLHSAAKVGRPSGVHAYVTGDPATIGDLSRKINSSVARTTLVGIVLVGIILMLIYRSPWLPIVPGLTIGAGLMTSRDVVALLGHTHALHVSTYTASFLTCVVLGAATDYSVFLISRYHEAVREGRDIPAAVAHAMRRVGAVILASGGTVIIGSACMALAQLSLFRTTGPPLAVAVAVTLLAALTMTPAVLLVGGERFAPKPQPVRGGPGYWERVGTTVARRPVPVLIGALILMGLLASAYPSMHSSINERKLQPASDESNLGYTVLARHFDSNELTPDVVVLHSTHDLRNSHDLAVLETLATQLSKLPDVASVRAITRPTGAPLTQATIAYQSGLLGQQLGGAAGAIAASHQPLQRLVNGADQVSTGADQLASGSGSAVAGVDELLAGLAAEDNGLSTGVSATGDAVSGAAQLRDGAALLSQSLRTAYDQTKQAVDGLGLAYNELTADQMCSVDPICSRVRTGLGQIYRGERDQLLPGLTRAADAAQQISVGDGSLADGLTKLQSGLVQAQSGINRMRAGATTFRSRLSQLGSGATQLSTGAARLPAGLDQVAAGTTKLQQGLTRAAGYLSDVSHQSAGGFFLPAAALNDPRMDFARTYYLSNDGHTARLIMFGRGDPQDHMNRVNRERDITNLTLRKTDLAGSATPIAGSAAVYNDINRLANEDFRLVAAAVLLAVFLILALLLRSLVAPLYLLGSVALSYAAAMGFTSLFWMHVIGRPIEWTVPVITFVVLIAVGADYNIFLMSRVREESARASRRGVARAVSATGGVITSAGLIFAGSFLALVAAPVTGLAETGFAIAFGLLLDTFVVRSLVVPSIAALLGPANWWPRTRLAAD